MTNVIKVGTQYRCPTCHREIYSRRRRKCEFCGAGLPQAVRLSSEETKAVNQELQELRDRHQLERARKENEKVRAAQMAGGHYATMMMTISVMSYH
jgi:hypothetical protein